MMRLPLVPFILLASLLCAPACSKKSDATAPPPASSSPPSSASASASASASSSSSSSALAPAPAPAPAPPANLQLFPNTPEGAKSLASEFAKPSADTLALSKQLRPTPADYKSLFDAASAAKIDRLYSPAWDKDAFVVAPRQGQTEVQMASATVADLKAKNEKSKALPNAYAIVASHLVGSATIYAFRFVEPGKTDGSTYDGLVFLNGHWVLIPKPWRGLDQR
jgi:hypothetical protein